MDQLFLSCGQESHGNLQGCHFGFSPVMEIYRNHPKLDICFKLRLLKPIVFGDPTHVQRTVFLNLMIHVEKLKGSDMVALIDKTSRNLVVFLIHPSREYINKSYSVSGFCFLTEKVGQA